ncbi:MAG: MFS transporter [Gordonia sp. (in: high G+C Gram-positive bacteria)]
MSTWYEPHLSSKGMSLSQWKISAHPVSWMTLVVTSSAILITSLDAAILPSVLPLVKDAFDLDNGQAGMVNSLFFISTIIGALLFGWLSDTVGTGYRRTWVWIAAMTLSIIGGVFTFIFATSWLAFQLMRVVMGISRGGSEPTNVAIVGEWWQVENRGFAVGVHHIGFPLGQFVAPALISLLIGGTDWQTTFLLLPLIGLPIMVLQAKIGTRKNQQRVYDWITAHQLTPPLKSIDERHTAANPFRLLAEVIRVGNVRRAIALNFGFLWCELGVSTFLVVLLQEQAGMSTSSAILASGASGLTGWAGQIVWGTLSDHFGRKKILLVCIAGWVVTVLPILLVGAPWQAWLILLLWGVFRNAPYPVIYSLVMDSIPERAGSGMGLIIAVTTGLGGAIVSTVAGFVADHSGWGVAFAVLIAGPLLAIIPLMRVTAPIASAEQDSAIVA